jgi:N-methylhydantoinase A
VRDYSASVLGGVDIDARYRELERKARADMPGCRVERSADLRYAGQSYELNVPWRARDFAKAFHAEHHKVYGYSSPERAVEVVTLRVKARIPVKRPVIRREPGGPAAGEHARKIRIAGKWVRAAVYRRSELSSRAKRGPALVIDYGSTTLIPAGWRFLVDTAGNLIATKEHE